MIMGILFTVIAMALLGIAAYKSSRNKQKEQNELYKRLQAKQCQWTSEKA